MKVISCVAIDIGKYELTVENDKGKQDKLPVVITRELNIERSSLHTKIYQCKHLSTEPRCRIMTNGRKYVMKQCLFCGDSASGMIKKAEWPEDCKPWDEDISAQHKREEWELFLKHYFLQRESAVVEAISYEKYLRSPEWREKRRLVLERDNYLCQGCLKRRATQVHHRTYAHIFDELLYELVSVCDECHEKEHRDKAERLN